MANPSNPTPLTIGAEAEGVFGVIEEDGAAAFSEKELEMIRPVLIRPAAEVQPRAGGDDSDSEDYEFVVRLEDWTWRRIRHIIAHDTGVLVTENQGPNPEFHVRGTLHSAGGNPYYYSWRVVPEQSARIPIDDPTVYPKGVEHIGFELVSPAMELKPENLDEIALVYRCLCGGNPIFRPAPLTPDTCGFHVHVGIGAARFSAHQMRRIACVTGNYFSRLNRYYSYLAHASTEPDQPDIVEWACSEVRRKAQEQDWGDMDRKFGVRGGEHDAPLSEPAEVYVDSGTLRFSWQIKEQEQAAKGKGKTAANDSGEEEDTGPFIRRIACGELLSENLRPDTFHYTSRGNTLDIDNGSPYEEDPAAPAATPTSIADATRHIMHCPSAAAVAQLMQPGRLAASFGGYTGPSSTVDPRKPTIEFRQLSGTFHADAACAWIRVVAQLVRVAIDWPWEDVNKLLRACGLGERAPDEYDVFDLLVDIGCAAKAALIQDMILEDPVGNPFNWVVKDDEMD
ncbi:hypothetical protein PG987_000479 [Apiospora arundinis]